MLENLPHTLSLGTEKKKIDYLNNLFESVYLIDILERHRIKNKAEFEELVKIIASGIGAPTNPTKLENTFKSVKKINIDSVTISRYLGYMQDAFLIEKAERYDVKGKKHIGSLAKYYFTDIGLRNAILGLRQQEETHIMENIIYNHYAKTMIAGLVLLVSGQALMHILINVDLFPLTGQTLPMISHGNSSFLAFSLVFGILLSVSKMAQKKIEQETAAAAPIFVTEDEVKDGLDDLDQLESSEIQ